MSGGASDIFATDEERRIASMGIYAQLGNTNLEEQFGSIAAGIEACGMQDFIDNQIEMIASAHAWVHHMEGRMRAQEFEAADVPNVPAILRKFAEKHGGS